MLNRVPISNILLTMSRWKNPTILSHRESHHRFPHILQAGPLKLTNHQGNFYTPTHSFVHAKFEKEYLAKLTICVRRETIYPFLIQTRFFISASEGIISFSERTGHIIFGYLRYIMYHGPWSMSRGQQCVLTVLLRTREKGWKL